MPSPPPNWQVIPQPRVLLCPQAVRAPQTRGCRRSCPSLRPSVASPGGLLGCAGPPALPHMVHASPRSTDSRDPTRWRSSGTV